MESKDSIIILGNRLREEIIHFELKGRLDTGIRLYNSLVNLQEGNEVIIILSGGRTNLDVKISEAELMKRYCILSEIPENRIIIESKSLDTIGNGFFTRKIIDRIKNIKNIYVISSCYHMNRVEYIFDRCYGETYNLIYDHCNIYQNTDSTEHENNSLLLAKEFFLNISQGDISAIEEKLITSHALYSNKTFE